VLFGSLHCFAGPLVAAGGTQVRGAPQPGGLVEVSLLKPVIVECLRDVLPLGSVFGELGLAGQLLGPLARGLGNLRGSVGLRLRLSTALQSDRVPARHCLAHRGQYSKALHELGPGVTERVVVLLGSGHDLHLALSAVIAWHGGDEFLPVCRRQTVVALPRRWGLWLRRPGVAWPAPRRRARRAGQRRRC
jgi:hypothetical protein